VSGYLKAAVFYATYGHWTQSLLNARIPLTYHYQPRLDIDPSNEQVGWISDPLAKQILFMNFPNVEFRPPSANDEAYDLIVGSPPCVGFSRANPKARPDHPLNKHTFNFFKWVVLNGPKHFLMEMVPGILKSGDPILGPGIFSQCLSLIRNYYQWDYAVMNAADYGAAQTRERLYIWGRRRGQEHLESPLATLEKRGCSSIQEVLNPDLIRYWDGRKPDGKQLLNLIGKNGKRIAGAWGSLTEKKIGNRTLKPDGLMFTITSTSVRDCLHYSTQRLLSIPELKVLMGFPVGYFIPPVNAGLASKIVASGVDIRFASYLLEHIKMVLEA